MHGRRFSMPCKGMLGQNSDSQVAPQENNKSDVTDSSYPVATDSLWNFIMDSQGPLQASSSWGSLPTQPSRPAVIYQDQSSIEIGQSGWRESSFSFQNVYLQSCIPGTFSQDSQLDSDASTNSFSQDSQLDNDASTNLLSWHNKLLETDELTTSEQLNHDSHKYFDTRQEAKISFDNDDQPGVLDSDAHSRVEDSVLEFFASAESRQESNDVQALLVHSHETCAEAAKILDRLQQSPDAQEGKIWNRTYIDEMLKYRRILDHSVSQLLQTFEEVVLDPLALLKLQELIQNLQMYQHWLDLYFEDAESVESVRQRQQRAVLWIMHQSTSEVIFKKKSLANPYQIKLLTGFQKIDTRELGVLATLELVDSGTVIDKDALQSGSANFQVENNKAEFDQITVLTSTNMKLARLRFSAHSKQPSAIHFALSRPFIVITNESQWQKASEKLLIFDSFGEQDVCSWPKFANTLHAHFLHITSQDQEKLLMRPLYMCELQYFYRRFFCSESTITKQQVQILWDWLGACLRTIRFKRSICNMWTRGFIFIFVEKEHREQILANQGANTFLVRFSESNAGALVITCISNDLPFIRDHLIQQDEINTKVSMPKSLIEEKSLKFVLRLTQEGTLQRLEKHAAMAEFMQKKGHTNVVNDRGYILGLVNEVQSER